MTAKTLATYDMSEDAMGLAGFINEAIDAHIPEDESPVVYVYDPKGNIIDGAQFECETLTDGSKVYNLRLSASGAV